MAKTDTRTRRTAAQTRKHVLAVARELFYWHGIRATGVDQVAAEAGVAPTTLYRLFPSKDDLVAAYVAYNAEPYKQWLRSASRLGAGTPRERILAVFDALAEQVRPEQCRGCPYLMTLAEFPDTAVAARTEAIATKAWVRDHLRALASELCANVSGADPTALGDQLALVIEGVYASVQALGADGPARQARALATTIVDAATDDGRSC